MTWLSGLELVHSPRSWDMFKSISPHSSLLCDFEHRPLSLGQNWKMGTVVWPHLT